MANERQQIESEALRLVQLLSPSDIYITGKTGELNRKAMTLKWEIEKSLRQSIRDGFEEATERYKDAIDAYENSH